MELPKSSTCSYFRTKKDAADHVGGLLPFLDRDSRWIMTIRRVRSGDYSVYFVTDLSSEDTEMAVAKFYSETQVNT